MKKDLRDTLANELYAVAVKVLMTLNEATTRSQFQQTIERSCVDPLFITQARLRMPTQQL